MSYTVTAYLVDLAQLRQVCGSADLSLVERLQAQFADDFADLDAQLGALGEEGEAFEGPVPMAQALDTLVTGSEPDPTAAAQYGYALEYLCRALGAPLPNMALSSLQATGMGICEEMDGVGQLFRNDQPAPVELPPIAEFPGISFLTPAAAAQQLATMRTAEAYPVDHYQAFHTKVLAEYRSWLEQAVQAHRSIVTFLT